jgi:hypothetical protein
MPDEDFGREVLPGWKQKIANYFSMKNRSADYVYDFGDNWEHRIQLEKILPREKNINYPICIKGKRACPPEDCGGIWGYEKSVVSYPALTDGVLGGKKDKLWRR